MGRKTKTVVYSGQVATVCGESSYGYPETLVIDKYGDLHVIYVKAENGECNSYQVNIDAARRWMRKHKLGRLDEALCAGVADMVKIRFEKR